jgi:hypothetical protein
MLAQNAVNSAAAARPEGGFGACLLQFSAGPVKHVRQRASAAST